MISKKVISLAVLAGIMVSAGSFAADGKKGAIVTFKAQLRAATCDVDSTTKGSVIDWGVFTLDDTKNKNVKDPLGDIKAFDLVLSNCTQAGKVGQEAKMNVYAQGEASSGFPALFANSDAKSLAVKLDSGTEKDIATAVNIIPNTDTQVTLANAVELGGSARIPMLATLLLTQKGGVASDILNVPVTFTVSYN